MRIKKYLKNILFLAILFGLSQNILSQNNGPTAPEAVGFEPVDATDMVNLTNGNLAYVLPLMDIEGFPINLSYHAGITPNLEASWVGLGWYLNPGAINRAINGTPDDWKEGVGITFTSFSETNTYNSITASVGITGVPVSIGIGAHWGGGQGLSGSIQANLGIASAYADTNGNVGVGINAGFAKASYSNNSKPNYSAVATAAYQGDNDSGSIGYSSDGTVSASYSGAKGSVGMSFSGGGNFSIGGANAKGIGGSVSSSSSSDSQGDATIDTKSIGLAITVPIGPISVSLGFKKKKVKISILKGYENREWGALYASDINSFTDNEQNDTRKPLIERSGTFASSLDGFTDYMYRGNKLDTYSTRLPQNEEEFIGDYYKEIEKINFTFVAYDNYNVAAQGMMGSLTPYTFQNANIIGKGTRAFNPLNEPFHAFWHHGNASNNVQRSLTNNAKSFEFYFNGQFTRTERNDANVFNGTSLSSLNMNNLINEGGHIGVATGSNRARQGNYVEVFTNKEIADNQAFGLITPKDTPNSLRDNIAYFDPNGIGAYKITAADGKTYHFSLPVYHYEKIQRSQLENQEYKNDISTPFISREKYDCKNVNESRQFTRFATHWLLTAITGPDYVDRPDPNDANTTGTFNKEDYGYWVELEYGKWSDGFVWRSPYQDFVYDYNTNIKDQIESEDKGYYSFGRKQIYYLDRINSKNRTALFVKNIRYDAIGKALTFKYKNINKKGDSNFIGNSGDGKNENSLNYTNPNVYVKENGVTYAREYALRLDKIILIDADDASLINKSGVSNLGSVFPNYIPNSSDSPNWESPYFKDHYGTNYSYDIHQEQNVLDEGDLPINFVENHAIKVIQLNHNYQLVKETPSSRIGSNTYGSNSNAGRLTLNSIAMLGRGGSTIIPPTVFNYYDSNTITNPNFQPLNDDSHAYIQAHVDNRKKFVDAWGYMQGVYNAGGNTFHSKAELWSLKDIKSPTGATININYEEDDYWTEAFARRYWQEGLQINFTIENGVKYVYFRNNPNSQLEDVLFNDYFYANKKVYLDIQYHRNPTNSSHGRRIADYAGQFNIASITNNVLKIQLPPNINSSTRNDNTCDAYPWSYSAFYCGSRHLDVCEVTLYDPHGGNTCSLPGNGQSRFKYKLLANKVPEDETGGGLRVKEIVTTEGSNIYKATYDYRHPFENRSSGITSYAPVKGLKYVPYQSEIPAPGVMYEYVTMKETDATGNYNAKTRYRHHVLKPVFNIFNPEIELEILDSDAPQEDQLFWVNVTENSGGLNGNNPKKVEAKKIDININTALFGQIKSIEVLNPENQLLNKTEHQYSNGRHFGSSETSRGYVKETFNSLKTVFVTNKEGTSVIDSKTKRLLSISSKTDYKNILKKTISTSGGHKTFVEYSNLDPWLNSFRRSETTMADGTKLQSTKIPAYSVYLNMGSKVVNPVNKNMLTQEAMNITNVYINDEWKTINASVTTWNDTWDHVANNGQTIALSGLWRKHQNFVWKGNLDTHGTYGEAIYGGSFNWDIDATQTRSEWQKAAETTKYTLWSTPVETMDINGNYVASKMADDFNKTIAAGNARYNDMYYSGAEYVDNGNRFEGEVLGANYRTQEAAHTGVWSVKNNTTSDKVFEINKPVSDDVTANAIRSGAYRVSFWVKETTATNQHILARQSLAIIGNPRITLTVNGNIQTESETVQAGCWKQYNYYINIPTTVTNFNLDVKAIGSINNYFDDFRIHPVASGMSCYVYNQDTDQLIAILGANNMASVFCYDPAGRLCTTYTEVANQGSDIGGFKVISKNKYNYKDIQNNNIGCECIVEYCDDNDIDDDGVLNNTDNCPNNFNPNQEDIDTDGIGDVCDSSDNRDNDNDGILNDDDNCPNTHNIDQLDTDNDGIGDACEQDPINTTIVVVEDIYDLPVSIDLGAPDSATLTYHLKILNNDDIPNPENSIITIITPALAATVTIDNKGTASIADDDIIYTIPQPNDIQEYFDLIGPHPGHPYSFIYSVSDNDGNSDSNTVQVTFKAITTD